MGDDANASLLLAATQYYGIRGGSNLPLPDDIEMNDYSNRDDLFEVEDDQTGYQARSRPGKKRKQTGHLNFDDLDFDANMSNSEKENDSDSFYYSNNRSGAVKFKPINPVISQKKKPSHKKDKKKAKKPNQGDAMHERFLQLRKRGREIAGLPTEEEDGPEEEYPNEISDDACNSSGTDDLSDQVDNNRNQNTTNDEDVTGDDSSDESPPKYSVCTAPDIVALEAELGMKSKGRSKCFGCTHGRRQTTSVTYEFYKEIERIFNERITTTEPVSLCKILAVIYERVRNKANKKKEKDEVEMPEWDAATIYDHFMDHINERVIRLNARLNMLNTLIRYHYKHGCWMKSGSGRKKRIIPSDRGIKILKDLIALETKLYSQNPRNGMFTSAGIGSNSDEIRPFINADKLKFHTINAGAMKRSSVIAMATGGKGGTIHGTAVK